MLRHFGEAHGVSFQRGLGAQKEEQVGDRFQRVVDLVRDGCRELPPAASFSVRRSVSSERRRSVLSIITAPTQRISCCPLLTG